MRDEELIPQFAQLFRGRFDAVGMEEGGCEQIASPSIQTFHENIDAHLSGIKPIGVYPLVQGADSFVCGWGCIDYDEGEEESWTHARNTHTIFETFGITSWLERSRSKGYHVWVFFNEWVPASTVRRSLLGAAQIVKAPTKEINPKQETLGVDDSGALKVGNYVRLPYPGAFHSDFVPQRRVMLNPRTAEPLDVWEFVEEAKSQLASCQDIEQLLDLYKPPPKPKRKEFSNLEITERSFDGSLSDGMERNTYMLFRYGPYGDGDRSSSLWKLARKLYEEGYSYSEALGLVVDADARWGKFANRGDVDQVEKLVQKAFR